MEQPPVRRADFGGELTPLARPQPLPPPRRHWSDEAWQVIRQGLMPRDMDDRWAAFVEDDRLCLYRSWTGYGVYEARFVRDEDGWVIAELVVCGDRSLYQRGSDAYETAFVELLINAVLLGDHDPDAWERLEALWEQPAPAADTDTDTDTDTDGIAAARPPHQPAGSPQNQPESGEHTGVDPTQHPQ